MSLLSRSLLFSSRFIGSRGALNASRVAVAAFSRLSNLQTVLVQPKSSTNVSVIGQNASYSTGQAKDGEMHAKLATMIKQAPIVVFMKGEYSSFNIQKSKFLAFFISGTAEQPLCGFSKAVCDILRIHGVPFETHNVLADESLRSGIKEFSNWPTIPQVFFDGEFIGGCDIMLEMHRSGELVDELKKIGFTSKVDVEEEDSNDDGKNKK
jgi:monothiol glutaredoxin